MRGSFPAGPLVRAILHDPDSACWYEYRELAAVLKCSEHQEVMTTLSAAEQWVNDSGGYAVGWVAYEAAPAIDRALDACVDASPSNHLPLVCFGLFRSRQSYAFPTDKPASTPVPWLLDIRRSQYNSTLELIDNHIRAGDFYQVNFSARCTAQLRECEDLFHSVARDALYGAYLECDDYAIVSASPELFFAMREGGLLSRPMKGTASRAMDVVDDMTQRNWLARSEKNRAENLMIVDMVRNDMGRVAQAGSVQVEKLFAIEAHSTVWQMTSTVKAKTASSVTDVFSALFPAASITGAPKCASMKFIAAHESSPRGVYTGAIGVIERDRCAQFSVAIRTVGIDLLSHQAVFGVGGGIVADSVLDEEYAELISKTRVLAPDGPQFSLLETMRLEHGHVYLLNDHLNRAQGSARRFGFGFDRNRVRQEIDAIRSEHPAGCFRLRLVIDHLGGCTTRVTPLITGQTPQKIRLARMPVAVSEMLGHKTTDRRVYETAAADYPEYEVVLCNSLGYLTESTIANIVFEIQGQKFTPPLADGVLPGVLRGHWLATGEVTERSLHTDERHQVERWFLINALRGCREAIWCED